MALLPSFFIRKSIVWLFLAVIVLCALSLALTFAISKTQKAAADAVLHSTTIERRLGKIESALLIGSSSRFPGPNGCMDFVYLVLGGKGVAVAKVRAEANNSPVDSSNVVEVVVGWRSDFSIACWARR